MYAAATESRDLAGRVEPVEHAAVRLHDGRVEVRLQPAQGLAREQTQPHRDERPVGRVEDLVRFLHPHDLVAEVVPGIVDCLHLRILGKGVVHLPVSFDDLGHEVVMIDDGPP